MPLSKDRMRERKRADRASIRFDASRNTGYVKPNSPFKSIVTDSGEIARFDADGNGIYDD